MDKNALFAAIRSGRKTETVDVNGVDVVLHEITAGDFLKASEIGKDDSAQSDAFIIVAACDDLTDDDIQEVITWPMKITRDLSEKVIKLSGLLSEDDDAGKSETMPT